jgi:hypothetical protein
VPLAGTQDDGDRLAAGCIIDVDRQEAAVIVVGVEQRELSVAVNAIQRVVDIEDDAPRTSQKLSQ